MVSVDTIKYPVFAKYASPFVMGVNHPIGREAEVKALRAQLSRPELSNVVLLGAAGVGKTALVEILAGQDTSSDYFEVDFSKMSAEGENAMAANMKMLVEDVRAYQKDTGNTVVLFMDEFHQLVQLSPAATEAIKPILARSGLYNIKIIAATTFEEYVKFIEPNEALNERLQRLTISEPPVDLIRKMLRGMTAQYAPDASVRPSLYDNIIDISNRYLPSRQQPRKSRQIYDAMLGYHKAFGTPLDEQLLNQVIFETIHVNTQWHADVEEMADFLHASVFGQDLAIETVINRLQISIANLADESRPQGSFIFSGSTGVGKTELVKAMTRYLFGTEDAMVRFDMSEYSEDSSVDDFREKLSDAIRQTPYAVVLLDEIEKASDNVALLLLQVLDDARLSDRYGRQVTFSNAYIVLTTNLANEVYDIVQTNGSDTAEYLGLVKKALTREGNGFRPELLGRIDKVVPFNPLSDDVLERIAKFNLQALVKNVMRKHNVKLRIQKSRVIDYLVYEHFDSRTNGGGGRALKNRIGDEITTPVSKMINLHPEYRDLTVTVKGDMSHGEFGNKYDNRGSAEIVVGLTAK